MRWLRDLWGWLSGTRLAAVLGTILAVIAGAAALYLRGRSAGKKEERGDTAEANREVLGDALERDSKEDAIEAEELVEQEKRHETADIGHDEIDKWSEVQRKLPRVTDEIIDRWERRLAAVKDKDKS